MDILFLLGAVQALFLELVLWMKKNKSVADKILAAWMLFIAIHLSFVYLNSTDIVYEYPHLLGVVIPFPMLHGPFLYFYIYTLTQKEPKFRKRDWLHALPFFIMYAYLMEPFFLHSAAYKAHLVLEVLPNDPPFLIYLTQILYILSGVFYVVTSFILLRKHKSRIADSFSYTEKINLDWMWYMLVSISVVWAFVFVMVPLENFLKIDIPLQADDYIYGSLSAFVFLIGYFGIQQTHIFSNTQPPTPLYITSPVSPTVAIAETEPIANSEPQKIAKRYEKSGLKEEEALKIKKTLLSKMEKEQPYLNPKLNLSQLAILLDVPSNYLSQVINEHLDQNFYEFVNTYRVNAFKQKSIDSTFQHLTMLAIAYECGFGSKSSFNNIFKKIEGITPSAYVKSAK